MRRFTEESVWRKSVDQEDIVEKQLQNKGRSECGTDIKDELHEECGVFGAYNLKGEDIANWVYYGLFSLQHRGQESCGIAVSENRDIRYYKDIGLVSEVLHRRIWTSFMVILLSAMCVIQQRAAVCVPMHSLW